MAAPNEQERQAAKKIVALYMSIGVNTTGAKFAQHIAEALADFRAQYRKAIIETKCPDYDDKLIESTFEMARGKFLAVMDE